MVTRAAIITEAMQWLHTPYHHHAQRKGTGCDCVGLLIGTARALDCLPPNWRAPYYSTEWHLHRHEEVLLHTLTDLGGVRISPEAYQPGDILVFRFGRVCSHAGIALPDNQLIHAARDFGKVVRHALAGDWRRRLQAAYQFPGLEPGP